MTGVDIRLAAHDIGECEWADMSAETQVIYALVREAIEQAGYELDTMRIKLSINRGTSVISCEVEI